MTAALVDHRRSIRFDPVNSHYGVRIEIRSHGITVTLSIANDCFYEALSVRFRVFNVFEFGLREGLLRVRSSLHGIFHGTLGNARLVGRAISLSANGYNA